MHRFTRLATGWLAAGGIAVLVVLHFAGMKKSQGPTSVNNHTNDNGSPTQLAAAPKAAQLPGRRVVIHSPDPPQPEPTGDEAVTSQPFRSIDLPCSSTSLPSQSALSTTVAATSPDLQSWADATVNPSVIGGSAGIRNTSIGVVLDLGNPSAGPAIPGVGPALHLDVPGQSQPNPIAGLLQVEQTTSLPSAAPSTSDNQCLPGP